MIVAREYRCRTPGIVGAGGCRNAPIPSRADECARLEGERYPPRIDFGVPTVPEQHEWHARLSQGGFGVAMLCSKQQLGRVRVEDAGVGYQADACVLRRGDDVAVLLRAPAELVSGNQEKPVYAG